MIESPRKVVCFFNTNRAWGGGEKWHLEAALELSKRHYQIYLVTNVASELRRRGNEARLLTYCFGLNNLSFLNPIKILVIAAFLKSKKIDTIILNLPIDLKVAGMAAKIAGVKNIIYRRGMPHALRSTWLNRFLFTKVITKVIVNSLDVERSLIEGNEGWFPKDKTFLLYNGIDTAAPPKKISPLYEKKNNEFVIGNAGRLTEQKGQKYLIEIASRLKQDHLPFKMLIAGEGELREELSKQIKQAGLEEQVTLLGHVKDMNAFYNSLDAFAFTSLWEGMANTLVEVLWHGIPTVAWDVSSNKEIIDHELNGWIVPPYQVDEFVKRLKAILSDNQLTERVKREGQKKISTTFSNDRAYEQLEKII